MRCAFFCEFVVCVVLPFFIRMVRIKYIAAWQTHLQAIDCGFDFVAAPLFHPRFRRDADGISARREGAGTRSDLVISSERWSSTVVGKLSPWLDLDSPVTSVRLASERALKQEVAWASHLTGALTEHIRTFLSISQRAYLSRRL